MFLLLWLLLLLFLLLPSDFTHTLAEESGKHTHQHREPRNNTNQAENLRAVVKKKNETENKNNYKDRTKLCKFLGV